MRRFLASLLLSVSLAYGTISAPSNSTTATFSISNHLTAITFPGSTTSGNVLIFASVVSAGSGWLINSISDTSSNTWTKINRATTTSHVAVELWICQNNNSSATQTVTASWNSTTTNIKGVVYVGEIAGAKTSTQPENNKTGNGTSTALATASWTPAENNCMIIAVGGTESVASQTFTAGTSFTIDKQAFENSADTALAVEYLIQTSAAATTAPMTAGTSAFWAIVGASLKQNVVVNTVNSKARIQF